MANIVSGLLNDLDNQNKSAVDQMKSGDSTVTADRVIDSWRTEAIAAIHNFKEGASQKLSPQ
jgi:hypothetical protein